MVIKVQYIQHSYLSMYTINTLIIQLYNNFKAWWSNFMQNMVAYCETWGVHLRLLSPIILKAYNGIVLGNCPCYLFCTLAILLLQVRAFSQRLGLEAPRAPIMTFDKWLVSLLSHQLFRQTWWWSWSTPESRVLMSVFAAELRSKKAKGHWKDSMRRQMRRSFRTFCAHTWECGLSVCTGYSSWGSDKIPDYRYLRLTVWGSSGHCGWKVMAAGVQSSWSHCIPGLRCREKWVLMLNSLSPISGSCHGAIHMQCRTFLLCLTLLEAFS